MENKAIFKKYKEIYLVFLKNKYIKKMYRLLIKIKINFKNHLK
jgi:hypothetical protein